MNTMKRHWLFDLVSRNTFHCNLVDNGLNQYGTVTSGGVTDGYTYNPWGALTGTRPFSYGYYDNLLCGVYTNRTLGQSRVCSYDYDALKRRRTKDSTPRNASRRYHYYVYSGWSLLCETLTTDHFPLTTYFVWGKDLSGTLDGAGGVFAMHNAQCIMHKSPDSDEGQPRPRSLCIVHYELCIDVGLYYYGYRYYSPELGRWLTRDPIEEDGDSGALFPVADVSMYGAMDWCGSEYSPSRLRRQPPLGGG